MSRIIVRKQVGRDPNRERNEKPTYVSSDYYPPESRRKRLKREVRLRLVEYSGGPGFSLRSRVPTRLTPNTPRPGRRRRSSVTRQPTTDQNHFSSPVSSHLSVLLPLVSTACTVLSCVSGRSSGRPTPTSHSCPETGKRG